METKNKARNYFKTFLSIATGAGTVVGGAYILSRLKEKQNTETRLERIEQIVEEISSSEEQKGKEYGLKKGG